jgi:hypothetical protein
MVSIYKMAVKLTLLLPFQLLPLFASSIALATADGPDFYRVRDSANGDALSIHKQASPHADIVGTIPATASCIKNLGCQGGLSLEEFTRLSTAGRTAANKAHPRWCHIEYQGINGWVPGHFLAEGSCD